MNIHSLQVVVWLTTLWIAECLPNYVPVFVQKGENLTLTCDDSRSSWREYIPFKYITSTSLGVNTPNYTVRNVSEDKLHYGYGCEGKDSKLYVIYPINAINKPVISSQGNGSYVCSANGTGFGQLLLNWTVNDEVIPGNTTTNGAFTSAQNTTTNGAFTSAQSKLMVGNTTQITISCTAYYSMNETNSSTSNFDKGSTTITAVTQAPTTESPEHSATASSTPLPRTSTPSLGPSPSSTSITPYPTSHSPNPYISPTLVGAVATLAFILVVSGCILVAVVLRRRRKFRSRLTNNNNRFDPADVFPPDAFQGCLPAYNRQIGVLSTVSNLPSPLNIPPPVPPEESNNYEITSFTIQVDKDMVTEPVYAHLNHPMPKPSAQVGIYSQLKPNRQSSPSLHSGSSCNSHTHFLPPQQQRMGHCSSCHGSQSLCPCSSDHVSYESMGDHQRGNHNHHHNNACESSFHHSCCNYEGSHMALVESNSTEHSNHCCSLSHSCHNSSGTGHVHSRSGSATCYEEEQTALTSSWPAAAHNTNTHTQQENPTSTQRVTRPAHLPLLVNCDVTESISFVASTPTRVKTATSHLQPLQPQRKRQRSKSLSTITEMPTPMPTPTEPQLQSQQQLLGERAPTPMPPLHGRGQQAAFSTHDIPAIVLSSGTPDSAPNRPLPLSATFVVPCQPVSQLTTTSQHHPGALTSTVRNQMSSAVELPSEARSIHNLLQPDHSTAGRSQNRKSAKEQWVLPPIGGRGRTSSLRCKVIANMGSRETNSLPPLSYSQGYSASCDSGYGYEDVFHNESTRQDIYMIKLPDWNSAETLV